MDRSIEQHRNDYEIRLARATAPPGQEVRRALTDHARSRRRGRWADRLRAAADRLDS